MTARSQLLKVWFNGTERVIAEDEYAARDIVVADLGCYPDEVEAFTEVPMDEKIRVEHEDYEDVAEFTAREWIEKEGRGFLSSTEMP